MEYSVEYCIPFCYTYYVHRCPSHATVHTFSAFYICMLCLVLWNSDPSWATVLCSVCFLESFCILHGGNNMECFMPYTGMYPIGGVCLWSIPVAFVEYTIPVYAMYALMAFCVCSAPMGPCGTYLV